MKKFLNKSLLGLLVVAFVVTVGLFSNSYLLNRTVTYEVNGSAIAGSFEDKPGYPEHRLIFNGHVKGPADTDFALWTVGSDENGNDTYVAIPCDQTRFPASGVANVQCSAFVQPETDGAAFYLLVTSGQKPSLDSILDEIAFMK